MPLPAHLHPRACEVCSQTDTFTICRPCRSVWYCSSEHKAPDREKHEEACATIETARVEYEFEELMLRKEAAIYELPSYFETDAGHFGRIDETRRYLLSRLRHAHLLLYYFGSTDGEYTATARVDILETVLAELLYMLRLSRADDLGAGIAIPSIYIALGRDQETAHLIHTLKHQTLELYLSVAKSNTPFWDLMLDDDPETVKSNEQRALEPSSCVEADLLARYNFTPWLLNPAALGAVRAWREWNSSEA